MAEGYGALVFLFVYAILMLIIIFAVIGIVLLILSFYCKFKQRKGKTFFTAGLICLIPAFAWIINGLIHDKQEWDELGPLMQAVEKHDYKKAEKAIHEGSNINEINYTTYPGSPLTYAISKKDLKMVQLLVENGADINFEPEGRGSIPLNHAIFEKDVAIVTYLLENGADVLRKDEINRSNRPISYAIRMNAGKEIIDMLREYAGLQQQNI